MKHIGSISKLPAKAQTQDICDNLANDFQAQLCFIQELLVNFFLPVLNIKADLDDETEA